MDPQNNQPATQQPVVTPPAVPVPPSPTAPQPVAPVPAPQPVAQPTLGQVAGQPPIAPGTVQAVPGQPPPATVDGKRKKPSTTTQNALQLAEIRDGVVIMNDGSFRSVVMAKSINFDLMSPEEREAVEYAYASFLNSLYFPIQISIRSTRVDIRSYLEKLDKLRLELDNMLLALLMEDYVNFIAQLAEESNIMDKQFYIVVPYYPAITTQAAIEGGKKVFGKLFDSFKQGPSKSVITINEAVLEEGKTELRNRVQAVTGALQQVGVQTVALDTKELSELFYNAYNPDTATRQQLVDFSSLSSAVIQKGQGIAHNPNLDTEQ